MSEWYVSGNFVFAVSLDDLDDHLARSEQDYWYQVVGDDPIYVGIDHDEAKEWALGSGEVVRIEEQ